jgi:hypothetical protein
MHPKERVLISFYHVQRWIDPRHRFRVSKSGILSPKRLHSPNNFLHGMNGIRFQRNRGRCRSNSTDSYFDSTKSSLELRSSSTTSSMEWEQQRKGCSGPMCSSQAYLSEYIYFWELKKASWTKEENARLVLLVQTNGEHWQKHLLSIPAMK